MLGRIAKRNHEMLDYSSWTSEQDTDSILGRQNPNFLFGSQVIYDQRTVNQNLELPHLDTSYHHPYRYYYFDQQRDFPIFSVLNQGLLQAWTELTLPLHHHLHQSYVLRALLESWKPPRTKLGVWVHDDGRAVLAIDEANVLVRVISFYGDKKLGVEAEVHLHVEGLDVKVFYLVGRDLGLEDGVEVEGDAGEEENQDDEETVAAADAFQAASTGLVVSGVVPGDIAAVWGWVEGGLLL